MKLFWKKQTNKNVKAGSSNKKKTGKQWAKIILIYSAYASLALVVFIAVAFAWFSKDLPTPAKIANMKPAISTKIYDRTGKVLLYETGSQRRTPVASDQISQYLKDATISVEDPNFYHHHGVDFVEIFKAIGSKLLHRTNVTRGASTITQQYVKNAFLTPDRSIIRKGKEAILAIELEFMFSKDQILTMYLNEISYGNSNAGIEAASQMYFGKSAKDLTLAEAATLAAIPQSPTRLSPYGTHTNDLVTRRNYVLDKMVKAGKISQADSAKAKTQDTITLGIDLKPRKDTILAPHFAMYVLEEAANKWGEDAIQKEGLNIVTTLDYDKQKMAQDSINEGVPKLTRYGAKNAALVSVDPKTGQILAMVGSKDYFDTSIDGNVNVADSSRQPGSSFKPIVYATAFKQPEYSPSKILFDLQTDFGNYVPQNYNGRFNGPITMRQALSNSLNIPAVKTLGLVGIDNALRTASDLGITTLTHRDQYGLSLVLGAGEVKPVEMAGAFGVFATGGTKFELTPFLKVTDSNSQTLYNFEDHKNDGKEVLNSQVAYEISNILSDNNARSLVFGTRTALYFPNRTVAVKTGTTSNFKDAWTVGYTPSLATAVWVGNSNGDKMSSGADGSVVAAPIFHSFVEKALANVPNEDFTKPAGIQTVTVEKYSNKLPGPNSTETTTDIFADWQVPKDQDNVHQQIKFCKGLNLLAPDGLADQYVETRNITVVHSEKPDNPNWENPVRAWAQAHGMYSDVPTDYCDSHSYDVSVKITAPQNSATVSGSTLITTDTTGSQISKVDFLIDGIQSGETTSSPYQYTFDFNTLSEGSHLIDVVATNQAGATAKDEIPVIVSKSPTSSAIISQISSKVTVTNGVASATISWTTNIATSGSVAYHLSTDNIIKSAASDALTTSHSIVLSGLSPNQTYVYTITSTTSDGTQSTSSDLNFSTSS